MTAALELELPEVPGADAGADPAAARQALEDARAAASPDSSSTDSPGAIGASGTGEAAQTAPQTPTGKPGARDRATAPAPAAAPGESVEPPKKWSKRALLALKKGPLVKIVLEQQTTVASLEARIVALEQRSAAAAELPPEHGEALAREAVLTASGLVVVFTQDGRYMLNPDQIGRLSKAWGGVAGELPPSVVQSPWSRALLATAGVASEKFFELRQEKPAAPPAA